MTAHPDWIEHRRGDGELLGWMLPEGEGFLVIDLLGRPLSEPVDWLSAEEYLEDLGIGYLAEPFELRLDSGSWLRVRLVEVSVDGIRVKKDDWGDMSGSAVEYALSFPIPDTLRPLGAAGSDGTPAILDGFTR